MTPATARLFDTNRVYHRPVRCVLVAFAAWLLMCQAGQASSRAADTPEGHHRALRINLVNARAPRTPNPPPWLSYDGSAYTAERRYGWLDDKRVAGHSVYAADRGLDAAIIMPDGQQTSPRRLGRPELASWHGRHRENRPLVFRVDLPDGWYRVACSSVDPGTILPLVDIRSFKCRSHDAVFAGPRHGPALRVAGPALVEGHGLVEVTDSHLRVVIGDPAYSGWRWSYPAPWWRGWRTWIDPTGPRRYAEDWWASVTRVVDPGFHTVRLNSLVVEPAMPPAQSSKPVFRDFFNRADATDINAGVASSRHWRRAEIQGIAGLNPSLEHTAAHVIGSQRSAGGLVLAQGEVSPPEGIVRYATSVSLFTGEGTRAGGGRHEAGILILADPQHPSDPTATFIGVVAGPGSGLVVRAGNADAEVARRTTTPAVSVPMDIAAGEYELVVEHDVTRNVLTRILVNGLDVTNRVSLESRRPTRNRGVFGIRAMMDPAGSGIALTQSYWFYRVDLEQRPSKRL